MCGEEAEYLYSQGHEAILELTMTLIMAIEIVAIEIMRLKQTP